MNSLRLIVPLAYRNLVGTGLRTLLNVGVLSLVYVLIIWHQGLFLGILKYSSIEAVKYEYADGQYWHNAYDPCDPLSLDDGHGVIPPQLDALVKRNEATPILIRQATIYPDGRMQSILLKGIDPQQTVLAIPSSVLATTTTTSLPILVGARMAHANHFALGDTLTLRWRDVHGTFDAIDGTIVAIMNTNVPTIDNRQVWIPLSALQSMADLSQQATMVIVKDPKKSDKKLQTHHDIPGWKFKTVDFLISDIRQAVQSKRVAGAILYILLLFVVMLAMFDTQVLAIFKRKKEIGTLIALGMTRVQVIALFTTEGILIGILALCVGLVYGIPIFMFTLHTGIPIPQAAEQYGIMLVQRMIPYYPLYLILGTAVLIMIVVTIVSFLPTRKIAKLNPVDALRKN